LLQEETAFQSFITNLKGIFGAWHRGLETQVAVKRISQQIEQILERKDLVEQSMSFRKNVDYLPESAYLLFEDPAYRWTLSLHRWGPGAQTPVHNHGEAWAFECLYKNRLEVTRYRRVDSALTPEPVKLKVSRRISQREGQVDVIAPMEGIHRVNNPSSEESLSLHLYSKPLGIVNRYQFAVDTGLTGGYDHAQRKKILTPINS
jgi:predicted metal-dependent enzyme (double-stranded beta helix superfamily)